MNTLDPITLPYALHFDPVPHGYTLNGSPCLSVTQVIDGVGMVTGKAYFMPEHALRGTAVHTMTQFYDEGDLGEFDPLLHGFLDGYIKFRQDTGFRPRLIECKLGSLLHGVCGTLDRTGDLGGIEALIDIKSGAWQKWHDIQLEGYKLLLEENRVALRMPPIRAAYVLQLNKDGSYMLIPQKTDPRIARSVFLSALQILKFKGVDRGNPDAYECD